MPRYIALFRFTEQGAKNIKQSTKRAHAFNKLAQENNVTVEGQYWTVGSYDGVLVLRGDSEEKILHCLTEVASMGNVRTASLRAFTDKEFDAVCG